MVNERKHASVFLYVGMLIGIFLVGILGLLVLRHTFDRMTSALTDIAVNQRARDAIGHAILQEITALEAGYFQLAPLSGLYEQRVLIENLREKIENIGQDLDILEEGGTFESVTSLNIGLVDEMTTRHVYESEPEELYCLPAIELRPKLADCENRMSVLAQLLEERMRLRKGGDVGGFFENIKEIKMHLMRSIPLFQRMKESANNLLYESSQKLAEIEGGVAARRHQYRMIESGITAGIVCAVLALSVLIVARIRTIVRKEREVSEELRRSEEFLKTVLESVTHPIFVVDAKTYGITMANSAAKAQSVDASLTHCHKFIFGKDTPCSEEDVCCPLQVIRKTREPVMIEQRRSLDGKTRIMDVYGYPILDQKREVHQMVTHCIDVTDRRKAEAERKELEAKLSRLRKMEAMGTMAGGIAHDLNNILAGVVGYPDVLLATLPKDSELREPIAIIGESGRRAAAVVEDLLTVARGVASVKEVRNLNDLVLAYLGSAECMKLRSEHPLVLIRTECAPDLGNMLCSPVHIQKLLMNLVQNAAAAIEDKGNIEIKTERCRLDEPVRGWEGVGLGDYVKLTISDTGKGISAEDIERIFEPFFTKRVKGRAGTGLGLAVVWNTVLDHDGCITVESGSWGTRFEVLFPETQESSAGRLDGLSSDELRGAGEKILVVDDDDIQRDVARGLLESLGYRVSAVHSGGEAVAFVKEQSVDLLLLDMLMEPGMDGLETFRQIRDLRPAQKALVVSGFSRTERVQAIQELGASGFLKKPYTLSALAAAIRDALSPDAPASRV